MNFAKFDQVLANGPNALGFRVLIATLERTSKENQATVLEYLDQKLLSWPDDTRTAPWSWMAALWMEETVSLKWTLTRTLNAVHPMLYYWSPDCIPHNTSAFEYITSITFSARQEFTRFVFDNGNLFPALRHIKTRGTGDCDDLDIGALSSSTLIEKIESAEFGRKGFSSWTNGKPCYSDILYDNDPQYIANNLRELSVRLYNLNDLLSFLGENRFPSLVKLCVTFETMVSWNKAQDCIPPSPQTIALLNKLEQLSILHVEPDFVANFFDFYQIRPAKLSLDIIINNPGEIANSRILPIINELEMTGQYPLGNLIKNSVTTLTLTDLKKSIGHHKLTSLVSLELTAGYYDTEALVQTISNKSLINLRHLCIKGGGGGGSKFLGNQVIEAIVQSELLTTLESLSIADGWGQEAFDLAIFNTFVKADKPTLKHLTFRACSMGDAGAALFQHGDFPQLEHLKITLDELSNAGFTSLFTASFPVLRCLALDYNKISRMDIDIDHINNIPRLRELHLSNNSFGTVTDQSPWHQALISQLWSLNLAENPLTDESLLALFSLPQSDLVNLELWNDSYHDEDSDEEDNKEDNKEDNDSSSLTIPIPTRFSKKVAESLTIANMASKLDTLLMDKYSDNSCDGYIQIEKSSLPFCDQGRELIIQSQSLRYTAINSIIDNVEIEFDRPDLKILSNQERLKLVID